jgi:YD repeat-containing protein
MSARHHVVIVAVSGLLALVCLTGVAAGSETINYTYDAKGRLVKVEHSGSVNTNVVANYSFDKADNRANVNVSGAP